MKYVRVHFSISFGRVMTDESSKKGSGSSSIWGGRFSGGPSEIMEEINASIGFDKELYAQDIAGSKAHCAMLARQGIITEEDAEAIQQGLDTILKEMESGKFVFKRELEDIHMNVEARLVELAGEAGARLHTARSRNDQVATDLKIWTRQALGDLDQGLRGLQEVLIEKAEAHASDVMPGFTHLQAAQPVTLGHHLMAYVEMFGRDRGRAADCSRRLNECPLGAAALAGTSFDIDRDMTAAALGFERPCANSLDAVSDRDFAMEFLSLAAILAVHLSRLAEEIVLWSSDQFGFIRLSDAYSTGSSIMPQKRNPDAAELIRAKTGRVIGGLNALLIAVKGLPLAYGKDMQEDKEPVFDANKTLALSIAAMTGMLRDAEFAPGPMRAAAAKGRACATDLADWLVKTLAMPFRQAHHVVGRIVKLAEEKDVDLEDLSLKDMQRLEPAITKDVFNVLGVDNSVNSRVSFGGTAPENVRKAVAQARQRFLDPARKR